MSQPPPYSRAFDYMGWSANFPTLPHPGPSLNGDFDGIGTTISAILANLALLQRDDGALANNSVTMDALTPEALISLGAGSKWIPRGTWLPVTAYAVSDVVTSGTVTAVCPVAHTSGAGFAADLAAGKWIKLFDSSGAIPADGSVTAPKIGAGAVTTDKIGFTALDLTGSVRAGGGLLGGTAPVGLPMHFKLDTGSVMGRAERLTDDQGAVGYQWVSPSITWEASVPLSGTALEYRRGGTLIVSYNGEGVDVPGGLRAVAGAHPTTGIGVAMSYVASVGYLRSLNANANTWMPLKLQGSTVTITAGGVDVLKATSAGVEITGLGTFKPGMVMDFAMQTAPAGWIECNGAAVSRVTYAALFAAIGVVWGAGDGSSTFNVPDFRGEFRRGWDHGRGVDAARAFGSAQADELKSHTHAVPYSTSNQAWSGGGANYFGNGPSATSPTGGSETRPRNLAVLVCIKT